MLTLVFRNSSQDLDLWSQLRTLEQILVLRTVPFSADVSQTHFLSCLLQFSLKAWADSTEFLQSRAMQEGTCSTASPPSKQLSQGLRLLRPSGLPLFGKSFSSPWNEPCWKGGSSQAKFAVPRSTLRRSSPSASFAHVESSEAMLGLFICFGQEPIPRPSAHS